eukprot:3407344-Pyramimonas_sp.AAC.1
MPLQGGKPNHEEQKGTPPKLRLLVALAPSGEACARQTTHLDCRFRRPAHRTSDELDVGFWHRVNLFNIQRPSPLEVRGSSRPNPKF